MGWNRQLVLVVGGFNVFVFQFSHQKFGEDASQPDQLIVFSTKSLVGQAS